MNSGTTNNPLHKGSFDSQAGDRSRQASTASQTSNLSQRRKYSIESTGSMGSTGPYGRVRREHTDNTALVIRKQKEKSSCISVEDAQKASSYASVAIEPFFSGFMLISITKYVPQLLEIVYVPHVFAQILKWPISVTLCTGNLGSDTFFFHPAEEAAGDNGSYNIDEELKKYIASNTLSATEAKILKGVATTCKTLASYNYAIGAAADAVVMAALSSNPFIVWPTSFILAALGIYYYHLGYGPKIDEHVVVGYLHFFDALKEMWKNPLKAAEFLTIITINHTMRGIIFGFIAYQFGIDNLGLSETDPTFVSFVFFTVFYSIAVAALSRTIPVYRNTVKNSASSLPEITNIRSEDDFAYKSALKPNSASITHTIIAATRSAPVSYLMTYASKDALSIGIASLIGTMLFLQCYLSQFSITADNEAKKILDEKNKADDDIENSSQIASNNSIDNTEAQNSADLQPTMVESTQPDIAKLMERFNESLDANQAKTSVQAFAYTISTLGRGARWVLAFAAIVALGKLMDSSHILHEFSDGQAFALTVLIATLSALADASLFNGANLETIAMHLSRIELTRNTDANCMTRTKVFFWDTNAELVQWSQEHTLSNSPQNNL